jgi:sec-independent protein translocase protein TatA
MDFNFPRYFVIVWGKKIPELMKGIGQGIREFNRAKADVKQQIEEGIKEGENKEVPKS